MRMWKLHAWMFITATTLALSSAALSSAAPAAQQPRVFVELGYPAEALAARVAGTVAVRVKTDASWRVVEAEALSGPALLRPAAVANARQWTVAHGEGTDTFVYRFEIDEARCNHGSRSLFQLVHRNLALITACTGPGRTHVPIIENDVPVESYGAIPGYPRIAKGTLSQGVVVLDLSIDASGRVTDARVLNGVRFLTEAAVDHAKTWRVRTSSARSGVVVYEFNFDASLCKVENLDYSAFRPLGTDHVRLSVCGAIEINVTRQDRE
jgi:TonB family protein